MTGATGAAELMVRVKVPVVVPAELMAMIVTAEVPAAAGVPEIMPDSGVDR